MGETGAAFKFPLCSGNRGRGTWRSPCPYIDIFLASTDSQFMLKWAWSRRVQQVYDKRKEGCTTFSSVPPPQRLKVKIEPPWVTNQLLKWTKKFKTLSDIHVEYELYFVQLETSFPIFKQLVEACREEHILERWLKNNFDNKSESVGVSWIVVVKHCSELRTRCPLFIFHSLHRPSSLAHFPFFNGPRASPGP